LQNCLYMITNQIKPDSDLALTTLNKFLETEAIYDFTESKNRIASGGSSHVLCDFFEFTDYLIPSSDNLRHLDIEDYYSALLSI